MQRHPGTEKYGTDTAPNNISERSAVIYVIACSGNFAVLDLWDGHGLNHEEVQEEEEQHGVLDIGITTLIASVDTWWLAKIGYG